LFVLSTTYIPQMRVPFTIFFAILIDFLPPKPPNRGAKLESGYYLKWFCIGINEIRNDLRR